MSELFNGVVNRLLGTGWCHEAQAGAPEAVALMRPSGEAHDGQALLVLDYDVAFHLAWHALLRGEHWADERRANDIAWLEQAIWRSEQVVVVSSGSRPDGRRDKGSRRVVTTEWVWALCALWCSLKEACDAGDDKAATDDVGTPGGVHRLRKRFWIVALPPPDSPIASSAMPGELLLGSREQPLGPPDTWPYAVLWMFQLTEAGNFFRDLGPLPPAICAPVIAATPEVTQLLGDLLLRWFHNEAKELGATDSHRLSNEVGPELLDLAAGFIGSGDGNDLVDATDIAYVQLTRLLAQVASPEASAVPGGPRQAVLQSQGSLEGTHQAEAGIGLRQVQPLRLRLADDQADRYERPVRRLLQSHGIADLELTQCSDPGEFLAPMLKNAWRIPGDEDSNLLLLDLRFWDHSSKGREAFKVVQLRAAQRLNEIAEFDAPTLERLPRLAALTSPSLPIILFSSSTQRDVIARLSEFPSIDVRSLKPAVSAYPQDTDVHSIRRRWQSVFGVERSPRLDRLLHAHGTWTHMLNVWSESESLSLYLECGTRPEVSVSFAVGLSEEARRLLEKTKWPAGAVTGPLGLKGGEVYRSHPFLWLRRDWLRLLQQGNLLDAVTAPWHWFETHMEPIALKWLLHADRKSPLGFLRDSAERPMREERLQLAQARDVGIAFADLLLQAWVRQENDG